VAYAATTPKPAGLAVSRSAWMRFIASVKIVAVPRSPELMSGIESGAVKSITKRPSAAASVVPAKGAESCTVVFFAIVS
jgi:hypothetical protein